MQTKLNLEHTVLKNATANLLRLGGSGIVALLLPAFLVRMLPKDVYGAWGILLQLTLYVTYFDFGIQTAVARFIAHESEIGSPASGDQIVSTAFLMLSGGALLAFVLVAVLALHIPDIFHQMPIALACPFRPKFRSAVRPRSNLVAGLSGFRSIAQRGQCR